MVKSIISLNKVSNSPSYQPIYEWEEVIREEMSIKLVYISRFQFFLNRVERKFCNNSHYFLNNKNKRNNIAFILSLNSSIFFRDKNIIPIFIDVWGNEIELLLELTKYIEVFFVTSFEIFNIIKEMRGGVYYIPLSVSDKWINNYIPVKDIDVIQVGRKNKVLHEYMMIYIEKFKDINYIYQDIVDKKRVYISTKFGNIGYLENRENYMNLLKRSKVSLVSSPGIDDSRKTYGIDCITPRFYESAINYSYMLGRYNSNIETEYLGLSEVCDNVKSYEQFENLIITYLGSKNFIKKKEFDLFIKKNLTSYRSNEIRHVLEKYL
jgi:hypothetical protein